MLELFYPNDLKAEVVEGEIFPLIDEQMRVVGSSSRTFCHSGSMALHPVVHLHIFNPEGKLYLQKRSMKKDIQPGKWDTSVGGHVDFGETLHRALAREAREELGLYGLTKPLVDDVVTDDELIPVELFQYVWQSDREKELVSAYGIVYSGMLHPDKDEVDEGRFWSLAELKANMGKGVFTPQFEQKELNFLLESDTSKTLFNAGGASRYAKEADSDAE